MNKFRLGILLAAAAFMVPAMSHAMMLLPTPPAAPQPPPPPAPLLPTVPFFYRTINRTSLNAIISYTVLTEGAGLPGSQSETEAVPPEGNVYGRLQVLQTLVYRGIALIKPVPPLDSHFFGAYGMVPIVCSSNIATNGTQGTLDYLSSNIILSQNSNGVYSCQVFMSAGTTH